MTHELYKTKNDIEDWLNQYEITNYELIEDKDYGYVVDINGELDLSNRKIEEIKVKFNIIKKTFWINNNDLISLKGSPNSVKSFNCSYNKLKTLEFSPQEVNGNFDISHNQLETLEGCPKIINGFFDCSKNNLKNINFFPEKVNGSCFFYFNEELIEIEEIESFEILYVLHKSQINKNFKEKLEKEISIDNIRKNAKIKL